MATDADVEIDHAVTAHASVPHVEQDLPARRVYFHLC